MTAQQLKAFVAECVIEEGPCPANRLLQVIQNARQSVASGEVTADWAFDLIEDAARLL